jgi:hypothetical protein
MTLGSFQSLEGNYGTMAEQRHSWQSCFVDPWRGVAHFDGITIEADPITSARPDRVLPCLEDEQVFFCRMVEALLNDEEGSSTAGKRAVDLGTGSGVFALHAATRMQMQVTGVDCCDRALDFAGFNKRTREKASRAGVAACSFHKVSDWSETPDLLKDPVDFVFLNAPFSPCLGASSLPPCADGGPDSQREFINALNVAQKLLTPGGRLFAVQLLMTDARGNPLYDFSSGSGTGCGWAEIRIYPILTKATIPAAEFIDSVYSNSLSGKPEIPNDLRDAHFCYAFIEFTKAVNTAQVPHIFHCQRDDIPIADLPQWDWASRIGWHRAVLENAAEETQSSEVKARAQNRARITLPSVSLFLDQSHAPLGMLSQHPSATVEGPTGLPSILSVLDRWIRLNGLLDDGGVKGKTTFDCIMVEAAPWHTAQQRLDLRTETAIWSCKTKVAPPAGRALQRILVEIEHINKEERSVFRHQDLEDQADQRLWQPAVLFSFLENDGEWNTSIQRDPGLNGPIDDWATKIEKIAPLFSPSSPNLAWYQHPLQKFGISYTNPSQRPLRTCLAAALHAYTKILRQENLLSEECETSVCYFCSLPLPPPQPRSQSGTSGTLYVYAWSSQEWSPGHETKALDLARAAGLLYEEAYSDSARQEVGRLSRDRILESAAHETRKLCYAIQPELNWESADLIRDFLNLTLEMVPLGETFQNDIALFAGSPVRSLSGLSTTAFCLQQLCSREWNADQLTEMQLNEWRCHARNIIKMQETGIKFNPKEEPSAQQLLHFVAAYISAIRNAVKNSLQKDAPELIVSTEIGRIIIANSYTSKLTDAQDRQPYKDKQQEVWISVEAKVGSEQVLARHAARMLPELHTNPMTQFISKTGCVKLKNAEFRHTWQTIVPHPFHGLKFS